MKKTISLLAVTHWSAIGTPRAASVFGPRWGFEGIRFRFTGGSGHSATTELASVITGPWTTLAAPTAPIGGLVEYTDTHPPSETAFYRTSAP